MIVKDEAAVLERCLDCVKTLVDEMIIVDTGSADGTKEIIKSYAGRLYEYDCGWMRTTCFPPQRLRLWKN